MRNVMEQDVTPGSNDAREEDMEQPSSSVWPTVQAGAAAGVIATAAMSVFMKAWQSAVPRERDEAIPPREPVEAVAEKLDVWDEMPPASRSALTWLSHFGYGTTMGIAYAGGRSDLGGPPAVSGALFGLGVWAASWGAWMPALEIARGPEEKSAERNALLIAAHLVWGAVLGVSLDRLERALARVRPRPDGERQGSRSEPGA